MREGESKKQILCIHDSAHEFDEVVSILQKEVGPIIARRINSKVQLHASLEKEVWDAIIFDRLARALQLSDILEALRIQGEPIPIILLSAYQEDEVEQDGPAHEWRERVITTSLSSLGTVLKQEFSARHLRREKQIAEDALGESERRYARLLTLAMDAIISVDEKQNIILFNSSAEEMFGYQAAEILGSPLSRLIPEEYRHQHHQHVEGFAQKGHSKRRMGALGELYGLHANGTRFPIEASISRSEFAGTTMLTAIVRDLTERKKLESQLLESQKQEILGKMAGGIAHDFNNVLLGILGHTELALKEIKDNPRVARKLELALAGAQRASELARQILDFSRPTKTLPVPVNLDALTHEVISFIRASTPKGVEFKRATSTGHSLVWGNSSQLHQVILNICANAAQAIKVHTGTVSVAVWEINGEPDLKSMTEKPWHIVGEPQHLPYVVVEVSDTGVGISADDMGRIFEPFFTTKPMGSGIGLEVVRRLVTLNHGFLAVKSIVDVGTTFRLFFPRYDGEVNTVGASAEMPAVGGKILVVDDEAVLCELYEEVLKGLNLSPMLFVSAQAALDEAAKNPGAFDLVMTDFGMPEMTGLEFLEKLRALGVTAPAILASGLDVPISQEGRVTLNVAEIIPKPFRIAELGDCVMRNLPR